MKVNRLLLPLVIPVIILALFLAMMPVHAQADEYFLLPVPGYTTVDPNPAGATYNVTPEDEGMYMSASGACPEAQFGWNSCGLRFYLNRSVSVSVTGLVVDYFSASMSGYSNPKIALTAYPDNNTQQSLVTIETYGENPVYPFRMCATDENSNDIDHLDCNLITNTWLAGENRTGIGVAVTREQDPDNDPLAFTISARLFWLVEQCPDDYSPDENNICVVSLNLPPFVPLLDRMVLSASPDCPLCTAQAAHGWGGTIDTANGNFSYQTTDMQLSVKGGILAFQRSYASGSIITPTTGADLYSSPLGPGWTHNYDMQLHFTGNELPDSIELQTPGGNRLPFIITTTNSITTYIPYAGVTASLTWDDNTDEYIVTGFNQNIYRFNEVGQLLEQEDPFGNIITFTYDGLSGLLDSASQEDRSLEYNYSNGYLISVEDSAGRTIYIDYNNDLLTVVTDTLGVATTYTYNNTLLTSAIDPTNRTLFTTTYDSVGRAMQQQDGLDNIRVSVDYTITDTHVITQNGVVMTHTYNNLNTLSTITMACNDATPGCQADTDKGYDYNFKTDDVTDPNGNPTAFAWSSNGSNLEQVTNPLSQDTFFAYDNLNSLTEIENARGYTTSYSYEDGNLPTFRTSSTDALQQTTIYTPTVEGLLEAQEDPNGLVTRYWYNGYGQVTQMVRAYGTAEAITMTYGYDAVGRLITATQISLDIDPTTSLTVYDAGNRLVATIQNWTGTNPTTWENQCSFTSGPRDTNICTRYGYDDAGRTISTTNPLGQTDLSFYDAAGRTYLYVNNYDGTPNYENDPEGVLCDWVTPDAEYNLCSLTEYDSNGRVAAATDVMGRVNRTFFDSLGRVQATVINSVAVTDDWEECDFPPTEADEDLCTVYAYDAVGNVVEVQDPAGRVTLTVYDELNRNEGTIINWDGDIDLADCYTSTWLNQTERDENVCTRYVYDEVGNTSIVSDTLGRISFTVYDELNRVAGTIANWDGTIDLDDCWTGSLPANRVTNVCTGYLYDTVGNQTVMTNTLGQMNLTVYDTVQRPVIQVTNWDGTSTTWPDDCADTVSEPDATENLCTFTSYDSLGRRADVTNARGHVGEFTYDGLGRVITTTRYLDSQPIETTVTYDALGNRLNQTDAEGHIFTTVYDSLNRPLVSISHEGVAITTRYNAASWVMGTINNLEHTTANEYDALGRLVMMTDGENHPTEYEYDVLGNQITVTDAEGVVTVYHYDDLSRLVSVLENETLNDSDHENNLLTQYRYDVLSNRVVITNALSITSSLTVYDTLNRPVSVKDALGNETQYQYNILGQRTVITDANGDITLYSYDDLNRLDTVSYETDNETVEYAYDALGNRTTMTDSLGVATYEYDDFSRVITVTSPLTGTVVYGYDNVGNRVELTYPNDYTVTYQYDGDNRLVEVEDWQEGITTYEYDPAGRLITTTLPNDVVTVNTYDDAHRLTNLTHEDGDSNLVASYTYALDDVGNRVVATETVRLPFQVITETQTSPTDSSRLEFQHPVVAYNSEDDEYMAIWQEFNDEIGAWYLYGQRVGTNGALLGTDLEIAADATEPAIAYSPEENQYLVVWHDADDYIQGVYIDADGSLAGSNFIIYDTAVNSQPDVAYNPNDTTFTVVWLTVVSGAKYSISSYKVDPHSETVVVEVAGEEVILANPVIAISSNGTQLIAWEMEETTYAHFNVVGQRLNSGGSLLGGTITIADDVPNNETTPAIAWNGTAGNFLVAWRNTVNTLGDTEYYIKARRIGTDGSLPGSIVALHSSMNTGVWHPDVIVSGSNWFVAWQKGTSNQDLYGRWVESNGTLGDETFDLITASSTQAHPALASDNSTGEMLLVWQDDRNSEDAIYHAILVPGHLETTVIDYTYDPLYRLVEADYSGAISAVYEYMHDEVGNMTAYTETVGVELVRVTRSFDDANQLQTSNMLDGPQLGTTSYYYDDNGNLTQILPPDVDPNEAGDQRYYYSQRNLLITSTVRGDSGWLDQATFTYDGLGNRVQQVDLTGSTPITTTYANDIVGMTQVLVAYAGNEGTSNLFGLDLIQQDTGAATLTLLTDGLGSVRLEMVEITIEAVTTYSPYGKSLSQAGNRGSVYGFTGEQSDSSTGLLYLRARYYAPDLHTLLSRDPWQGNMRRPYTMHGYTYVFNNPVRFADPTGMDCRDTPNGDGIYCTDPTNSTLTVQSTFINSIEDLTGFWDVLVYDRHGDIIFYGEHYLSSSCEVNAGGINVSGTQEEAHGIQYSVFGTEENGAYSATNYKGIIGADILIAAFTGYAEGSDEGGGNVSLNVGVEGSLINDSVSGSVEYSGDRMSFEGSLSLNPFKTPIGCITANSGFNVGASIVDRREVWVVVPSNIGRLYADKNALARDYFPWAIESNSFLPLRYSRTAKHKLYAPTNIHLFLYDSMPGQAFIFPFAETDDGYPRPTILDYYASANSCGQ